MVQRRPLVKVNIQQGNADQHEDAAEKRVEDKLQCGIVALCPASPELDEEVTWDQHEFPEDEEQDQVQGDEHAHGGRLERQQTHHVQLDLVTDGVPRVDHDEDRQKRRQAN